LRNGRAIEHAVGAGRRGALSSGRVRYTGWKLATGLYESFGGRESCRKLSTAFYARVARDPVLRPLFPNSFKCPIEEFAAFLAQFLDGPPEDTEHRWWLSLRESHQRFKIGPGERAVWIRLMTETLEDVVEIPEHYRNALREMFNRSSAYIVDQPSTTEIQDSRIARRWEIQLVLDQAVAAIRLGDFKKAIALAQAGPLREFFARDNAVHAHLLARIVHATNDQYAEAYVKGCITSNRALVQVPHRHRRTLLHEAAAAGRHEIVELLLGLGADPNSGAHSPLYSLANECRTDTPEAAGIVTTLVAAGAEINAQDAHQRTTALHMAARRGSLTIARALLDSGAIVDLRDSTGDTPLRRAVNCNRHEVAKLLLTHHADPDSPGSKRLTPRTAARDMKMRSLFISI
jgi:hemoglobin